MSKFYFVLDGYNPNTAATNRNMGMIREFSKRKIPTDVIFFVPDKNNSRAPELPYIHYQYYWNALSFIKNDNLKNALYLFFYIYLFAFKVKKYDTVLAYACNYIVRLLAKRKKVRLFQERTEHPDFSHYRFESIPKYLKACKSLDGLFVISPSLKNYFVENGVQESRVHIINMTVDISRFDNLEIVQPSDTIAYCGKISQKKDGIFYLIEAFARVHERYPNYALKIAGNFESSETEKETMRLVRQFGIEESVIFEGQISADQMPRFLASAKILALARPKPKESAYGFATKIGEYLMTGRPIVMTDTCDVSYYLKDREEVILTKPNDSKDFAEKLIWTVENYDKAKMIGENGKKKCLEVFNAEVETKKIIDVIFNKDINR